MDFGLKDKKALVFGGSAGLGRAIAKTLVDEGVQVAIASRDRAKLEVTQREIGARAIVIADLGQPNAARGAVAKAAASLGGLDILVINTGGPPKGTFAEVTAPQWQTGFQSLWLAAVDSIQAALPLMTKGHFGRILLVTSAAAKEPMSHLTVSNGLRAGLTGLAKSLSIEVASHGITVNCLLPGYTDTERLRELAVPVEKMTAAIPAGRLGKPEELGALAAFLASAQAAYITGQAIAVDGGYLRGH
jgi:3-oxoacyl-[acyl-carrier protein] reductase